MAGALQLLARLQAAPVPPVPPREIPVEPLEAAPLLEVPPVPPVPPQKRKAQNTGKAATTPGRSHTPTPAPQPDRRSAWAVIRGGRPICHMVGKPITYAEALEAARWRWPDADILEP